MENRYIVQGNLLGENTLRKLYFDTLWVARLVGRELMRQYRAIEVVDRMTAEVMWIAENGIENYDVTKLG